MIEITYKKSVVICQLAGGATNKKAAEVAGVSLSCVEKWKKSPDFKEELQKACNRLYEASMAEIMLGVTDAARELNRIITDPKTSDRNKISAAQILFNQANRLKEWQLEERLDTIELRLDDNGSYTREAQSTVTQN